MKRIIGYFVLALALFLTSENVLAQTPQWRDMHKVKRGETIYSIARDYNITVDDLVRANPEMATPDYVLKKGEFVCIPFPSGIPADTTTTAKPSPKPTTKPEQPGNVQSAASNVDMRNREIRVGVMLPLHKVNGDGQRMLEYYRGVLMACDSLRQNGVSVDVHAWNVAENTDIRTFLKGDAENLDLIIGPLYSKMMKPLSDFARKHQIKVLIPFSINTPELDTNPYLYQVYQTPGEFCEESAELFMKRYGEEHVVIIDCNDSTSRKGMFTGKIRKRLDAVNSDYKITNLKSSDQRFFESFTETGRNIVVLNTEKQHEFRAAISKINSMLLDHPNLDITLFGYTEWMLYAKKNLDSFYKFDVHVPTAFYYDEASPRTKRIEQKYRWNFHADMMNTLPHFAITGFDHAYYFIKGLSMYGSHFKGQAGMVGYPAIQTPLVFEQLGDGGHQNRQLMIVHYTKDRRIEIIRY